MTDTRSDPQRARSSFTLLAAGTALLAPAAPADAAKYPTITNIAPMQVAVGDTVVISGRNFISGANRTTVVFKRDGKQAVFVRAPRATKTKLTLTVPAKLSPFITGGQAGSKFRVRVLTKRFGRRFTSLKASPRILPPRPGTTSPGATPPAGSGGPTSPAAPATRDVPGVPVTPAAPPPPPDCDKDGTPDALDLDDDNDLLSDIEEAGLQTDRCLKDTDNDGSWDSWEYESARDFNSTNGTRPYPGKKPYPNALFPDQNVDYDGDGMRAWQEHAMWQKFGPKPLTRDLTYSDGTQRSDLASGRTDDNRDVDEDGLGNWVEANGPMQREWWARVFETEKDYEVVWPSSDFLDKDTDGDLLEDGADDTDQDGYTNAEEWERGVLLPDLFDPSIERSAWTQPFNPCLPNPDSPTCSLHPPIPSESYPPFDKPVGSERPLGVPAATTP